MFFEVEEINSVERAHYAAEILNEINPKLLGEDTFTDILRELIFDNFSEQEVLDLRNKVSSERTAAIFFP